MKWDKDDIKLTQKDKKHFFQFTKIYEEVNGSVKRPESLPDPWGEVAIIIMKYITCDGWKSMMHAYHF